MDSYIFENNLLADQSPSTESDRQMKSSIVCFLFSVHQPVNFCNEVLQTAILSQFSIKWVSAYQMPLSYLSIYESIHKGGLFCYQVLLSNDSKTR